MASGEEVRVVVMGISNELVAEARGQPTLHISAPSVSCCSSMSLILNEIFLRISDSCNAPLARGLELLFRH